ncbi:MAG: DUF4215 domain-containing protein [Deltaproteobacteria bacterium]|nr:DUF4215 domain-containing protein [Deltaproteobacteria bacterium]
MFYQSLVKNLVCFLIGTSLLGMVSCGGDSHTFPDLSENLAVCGNGFIESGEICDDGNDRETDACLNDCTQAFCGDGRVHEGVEACDDGNDLNNDDCTNHCSLSTCGDGIVQEDEACDDGNTNNEDGCLNTCMIATCGDGFVQAGSEECDDGNNIDDGSCMADCSAPTVLQVVSGIDHACVLLEDGLVKCWGRGEWGMLGYGNTNNIGDDELPKVVGEVSLGAPAVQLAAGYSHTCALLETGGVKCWGEASFGQLGYGNTEDIGDDELPSSVGEVDIGIGGNIVQLVTGGYHTCVLSDLGTVRCWGENSFGQLGYGHTWRIGHNQVPSMSPVGGDVDVGGFVTQLSAGPQTTCALLDTGTVRCWGWNNYGQLGYGNLENIGDDESPSSIGDINVGGTVSKISAGASHTCALLDTGTVRCWGGAIWGQLGYGNTNDIGDDEDPVTAGDVQIGGGIVADLVAYNSHTCVLLETGSVRCWGLNVYGQCGYVHDGTNLYIGNNELPSSVGDVEVGGPVLQLAPDGSNTCALLESGGVRCWGWNTHGELGYGNLENIGDNETPTDAGDIDLF